MSDYPFPSTTRSSIGTQSFMNTDKSERTETVNVGQEIQTNRRKVAENSSCF